MATTSREHLVAVRFSGPEFEMIGRAASLCGKSRRAFVREVAIRAAEGVPQEKRLIRMSAEAYADFTAALSAPAMPIAEIVELASRSAPWEPATDGKVSL